MPRNARRIGAARDGRPTSRPRGARPTSILLGRIPRTLHSPLRNSNRGPSPRFRRGGLRGEGRRPGGREIQQRSRVRIRRSWLGSARRGAPPGPGRPANARTLSAATASRRRGAPPDSRAEDEAARSASSQARACLGPSPREIARRMGADPARPRCRPGPRRGRPGGGSRRRRRPEGQRRGDTRPQAGRRCVLATQKASRANAASSSGSVGRSDPSATAGSRASRRSCDRHGRPARMRSGSGPAAGGRRRRGPGHRGPPGGRPPR